MSLETCAGCSTRYAVGLVACPNCRSADRVPGAVAVVPLMADTACTNNGCGAAGVPRRIVLARPVPGVVELPTLLCARCGFVLPLAWPGPVAESDGDGMPKITRHGGPSNKHDPVSAAAVEPDPTPATAADQPEIASPAAVMFEVGAETSEGLADGLPEPAVEGGEESSPGSNSSTSTEKPSTTPATSKPAPRKRTQAANRSTRARTENSSASSPDTSGPETDAPTDDVQEA